MRPQNELVSRRINPLASASICIGETGLDKLHSCSLLSSSPCVEKLACILPNNFSDAGAGASGDCTLSSTTWHRGVGAGADAGNGTAADFDSGAGVDKSVGIVGVGICTDIGPDVGAGAESSTGAGVDIGVSAVMNIAVDIDVDAAGVTGTGM